MGMHGTHVKVCQLLVRAGIGGDDRMEVAGGDRGSCWWCCTFDFIDRSVNLSRDIFRLQIKHTKRTW